MQRRNKLLLAALMTAVGALAVAVPASAATAATSTTDTTDTKTTTAQRQWKNDALDLRRGGWTAVCELLDMTPAEIAAEREAGKSLVQIAQSKGVSADELLSAMLEPRKTALDKLVAAGKISQERADTILKAMTERLIERINSTETDRTSLRDRLQNHRLDRDDAGCDNDERPAGESRGRGAFGRGLRGAGMSLESCQ